MVADDLTGALPTGRREEEDVALFVRGDEAVARQLAALRARIFDALAAQLGQFPQRDSFAMEVALFEDAVDGFEGILAADAAGARTAFPPADGDAVPRSEKEGEREQDTCAQDHERSRRQVVA